MDRPFVTELAAVRPQEVRPMYRVMDRAGVVLEASHDPQLPKETAVRMYTVRRHFCCEISSCLDAVKVMNTLSVMDHVLYEVQRQGRVSFYMTSFGEEAMHVGSAAALDATDWVFAQYREAGVLMWRGFTLANFMNQCYSNELDHGKGRQMPVHYGSLDHYFQTIASTLTTQLPHAAGAAYGLKLLGESKRRVVMCYFGDGAASEGDFHAALNMAATRSCPVIYFCRNNGYAISTSVAEQYRGDGIVSRAAGYGMTSIRVDGNDVFAVYNAVREARRLAIENQEPILIEAMSYRVGHHSTSDDSTAYRTAAEVDLHKKYDNPIDRLAQYLRRKGWWSDEEEKELHSSARSQVLAQLRAAEKLAKPPASELFTDVYDRLTPQLERQQQLLQEMIKLYPQDYDMTPYKQL